MVGRGGGRGGGGGRGVASSSMQGPFFSMLLPASVIGGSVVVGRELPNKKQGAMFTVSSV